MIFGKFNFWILWCCICSGRLCATAVPQGYPHASVGSAVVPGLCGTVITAPRAEHRIDQISPGSACVCVRMRMCVCMHARSRDRVRVRACVRARLPVLRVSRSAYEIERATRGAGRSSALWWVGWRSAGLPAARLRHDNRPGLSWVTTASQAANPVPITVGYRHAGRPCGVNGPTANSRQQAR